MPWPRPRRRASESSRRRASSTTGVCLRGRPPHRFTCTQANTAWGFATAGVAAPALFDAIKGQVVKDAATFDAQALSNVAWALATAGVADVGEAFEAVAAASTGRLAEFKPQEISNLCWSFAKAHVTHGGLFRAVAAEAAPRVATFRPQHPVWISTSRRWRRTPEI